jgi:hypothetical protein
MKSVSAKIALSSAVAMEYQRLIKTIHQVPLADRAVRAIEGTGGKVSISDLIAYQIGWGNLLLTWYYAGVNNSAMHMPGEGFTSWDYAGLARHFYKKYAYDKALLQEQEFHAVVLRILEMIDKETHTNNLDKVGVWQWCTLVSGKQWPLSKWIQVNTVAPYKRATALIKKYLKTKNDTLDLS